MFAELVQTIKKKEDEYVTVMPALKFVGMLGILLTFLVFNILLAGAEGRDPQANWRIGSLCAHVVLPIMYVADWVIGNTRCWRCDKVGSYFTRRFCSTGISVIRCG